MDWAKTVEQLGAGEILLTSVDFDGTLKGLDFNLLTRVSDAVNIPVIGSGGARNKEEIANCLNNSNISALAIGSMLHYEKDTINNVKKLIK